MIPRPKTHRGPARAAALLVASLLIPCACGGKPSAKPGGADDSPATERRSDASGREALSITVYNQNFGLVREIREVVLGTGKVLLEFSDVSGSIQPETVHIRALGDESALTVLEQNYRYDLLTPEKLLEKHVGKKVKVYRWNEKLGKDELYEAEILSVEGGSPVMRIDGEVTYGFPGRIAFDEVPANLIAKPTLVWLLESKADKQRIEITYLTQNLSWHADYVLVVDDEDERGDVTGWVTLSNQTGADYPGATLKLVAGDVQRIMAELDRTEHRGYEDEEDDDDSQFSEEGFFEYHLYTLERPTTLLDKEQKQVTLLEGHNIRIDKRLIFWGAEHYYRGRYGQVVSNQKVGVYLDIENTKDNGLGIPLPKGTVRVYKADKSGAQQFIGEDRIDHTPRDERIRIKMGEAFDVVGDRKQMDWTPLGTCVSETAWEISLRNHKDGAETVEVVEPIGGDWEILQASHPHKKKDAHTFTFTVRVPANGETKISYRVRVRWC